MAKNLQPAGALWLELERRLQHGRCVYCRAPAAPDRPLTREHVIPRSRGGRRKDAGIIVPACARCNHHRGCREFILFLLARPRRISSFLEYLDTLPPDCLDEVDLRVIAELYAAISLLAEGMVRSLEDRERLRRLCSGRRLHRRRYAARRLVCAVKERLARLRRRTRHPAGPSCPLPLGSSDLPLTAEEGPLRDLWVGLVTLLSRISQAPAEWVLRELARAGEQWQDAAGAESGEDSAAGKSGEGFATLVALQEIGEERRRRGEEVVSLERWNRRRQRWRRSRMDRRRGRGVRGYAA